MNTISSESPQPVAHDTRQAISFLKALDPAGPWTIVDIAPDGPRSPDVKNVFGRTFASDEVHDMAAYIEARQGKSNVYYAVNEIRPDCHDKPTKEDVRAIRATCADVDLTAVDSDGQKAEMRQMLADIDALPIRPTFTTLSGGGVQIVYKLARKLDPDSFGRQIENIGRGLKHVLGGDSVFNIDRIMRLPGTINLPDAKKRAKGREVVQAVLLPPETVRQTYTIDELAASIKPLTAAEATETNDADLAPLLARIADQFQPSPQALERVRSTATLRELWDGKLDHPDQSGSQFRWELARRLAADGGFSLEDFAGLVRVWDHATTQDRDVPPRDIARDWLRATAAFPQMRVTDWFQPIEDNPFAQAPDAPTHRDRGSGELIPFLRVADILSRGYPTFIVEGFFPEKSFGFLYSDPGAGKSFLALDLSLSLAAGLPTWQGEKINRARSKVLYIAAEGGSGFMPRVKAWLRWHESELDDEMRGQIEANFSMIERTINFMSPDDISLLIRSARGHVFSPDIVVVDTVSRAIPGVDENLQKDMSIFVEACGSLQRTLECCVIGIHHTNADGKMRGSTVFRGAGDFVFRLTRKIGNSIGTIDCEKQKDGEDGWSRPIGLRKVPLDGNKSSLVIVPATDVADESPASDKRRKTPTAKDQREAEAWHELLTAWAGPAADRNLDMPGAAALQKLANKCGLSRSKKYDQVKKDVVRRVNEGRVSAPLGQNVRWEAYRTGPGKTAGQAIRLVQSGARFGVFD